VQELWILDNSPEQGGQLQEGQERRCVRLFIFSQRKIFEKLSYVDFSIHLVSNVKGVSPFNPVEDDELGFEFFFILVKD
jgi:hypothetical protein